MASNFTLVDTAGWIYDLHSVYSAYIGYFQARSIAWYERSWGHLFESFADFLSFNWPVITVTDKNTGKPHVVTRPHSVGAFLKMIKTRFGETLPEAPNIQEVDPFETSQRHLRTIADYSSYSKLFATLPAVALSAYKARVKAGDPSAIEALWAQHDKTFLAIDFEWNERNESTVLEWGYAAVRSAHLHAVGAWPPEPAWNYRKGHYIVTEHVDKIVNKYCPTYPWSFGDSQVIPKAQLPNVIQAVITSMMSPDSETVMNELVLVVYGGSSGSSDLARLDEMKIKLPHNLLIVDVAAYERRLFDDGRRGSMVNPRTNTARQPHSTLSLQNLLLTFTMFPVFGNTLTLEPAKRQLLSTLLASCAFHNSGNDAFMTLFALQVLFEHGNIDIPQARPSRNARAGTAIAGRRPVSMMGMPMVTSDMGAPHARPAMSRSATAGYMTTGYAVARPMSAAPYDLSNEFGHLNLRSPGSRASYNAPGTSSQR
ncbi:hypothetical protein FISHEDRAFT_54397 [Fistulina hepatica ATCC 64428]|uniref:Gfd2/YDR514C-like C-terminal domain-containing protein n=1 Tax=Fistulina hepatica ATCC 64428 TaxID=1128425 RepID=A0A0D6ZYW4_9AGAR|nr:hypothetical protein FISHEDRAFT_54397 [Fistulina hepatica ATCC 64428]